MKHLIIAALAFIALSCEKTEDERTISFVIRMKDHVTQEGMPFSFQITGGSRIYLEDSTDHNGVYFGTASVSSYDQTYFRSNESYTLYDVNDVPLEYDIQNEIDVQVLKYGQIQINFSNVYSGYIQNYSRTLLYPVPGGSPWANSGFFSSKIISGPTAYSSDIAQLAAGQWVVSYERRPNTSSAWEVYSDTITIEPSYSNYLTIPY